MTPRGQALINLAKKTGTWEALINVQNLFYLMIWKNFLIRMKPPIEASELSDVLKTHNTWMDIECKNTRDKTKSEVKVQLPFQELVTIVRQLSPAQKANFKKDWQRRSQKKQTSIK